MTYKGTGWTRGDLGNVPDTNPLIACDTCDAKYRYQDYWKERYVEGKDWNPTEVTWICDYCLHRFRQHHEIQKRAENHKQLSEYNA